MTVVSLPGPRRENGVLRTGLLGMSSAISAAAITVPNTVRKPFTVFQANPLRNLGEMKFCTASRTVVLKLKTREFKILTRSHTGSAPPSSCDELTEIALKLRERVTLGPQQCYRLVGVGLSNFREAEPIDPQPVLFE
jgi:hypothetical protein